MPTARDTTAAAEADGLRIDESERKSWASIAFIRAGGMFSAPTLMVGASLGLGLALGGALTFAHLALGRRLRSGKAAAAVVLPVHAQVSTAPCGFVVVRAKILEHRACAKARGGA